MASCGRAGHQRGLTYFNRAHELGWAAAFTFIWLGVLRGTILEDSFFPPEAQSMRWLLIPVTLCCLLPATLLTQELMPQSGL